PTGFLAPDDSPLLPLLPPHFTAYALGPAADPAAAAQRLFDGLLTLEARGVRRILVEGVPEVREGLAVMNRVRKAAGEEVWLAV
ncbi:hypothetical protein K488DRAFT_91446, partial [Vararia minispora EC-137]